MILSMSKVLSVIIPTYNMERYLRGCLSSLLVSSHAAGLEVLVVNDGSRDGSLAVAREMAAAHPDVFRVIDKPNGNYGSCINRGLTEASGRYVRVLDADDTYDTAALESLLEVLETVDVDLVVTDYLKVDDRGMVTARHVRNLPTGRDMTDDEIFGLVMGEKLEMHEITYRTENLRRIGYRQTEGISFTDQEWTFLPMTTVRTARYVPVVLYRYLVGRVGQTVDPAASHRLQSHAERTMMAQVAAFNACGPMRLAQRRYLVAHLQTNLNFTYRSYLVYSYRSLPLEGLRSFDNALREAGGELYSLLDDETVHPRIPLHFIRRWRQSRNEVPLLLRLYRSILFPILRWFGKA